MKITYLTCDEISVIEEEIDKVEFFAYTLNGEEQQSLLCKRSKNNKNYEEDHEFDNCFEVFVEDVLYIDCA
jgi:hypothetical protein